MQELNDKIEIAERKNYFITYLKEFHNSNGIDDW